MAALARWSRESLAEPSGRLSTFRIPVQSLAWGQARAVSRSLEPGRQGSSPPDITTDLLLRLGPFPRDAAAAAEDPSRHGVGSVRLDAALLPIATFTEADGSAGGGKTVPLFVTHVIHSGTQPVARLLLQHLQTPPRVIAAAGQTCEPTGHPQARVADASSAAGAAPGRAGSGGSSIAVPDAFAGNWVRLRSVTLSWRVTQVPGMCIVYTVGSMAMHVPDHHAEIAKLLAAQKSINATATSGNSVPAGAAFPLTTHALAPSRGPPPQAPGEENAGADASVPTSCVFSARRGADPSDATCTAHSQTPAVSVPPALPYPPSTGRVHISTSLLYPGLERMSITQALGLTTPAVFRVIAVVVRAFPTPAVCWTVATPTGPRVGVEYEYRMVLQLADPQDPSACIGSILCGSEGGRFFVGLPPCCLRESNISLEALEGRVEAMRLAPPLEFCIMGCRPEPEDQLSSEASHRGHHHRLAYHIIGTELHYQRGR